MRINRMILAALIVWGMGLTALAGGLAYYSKDRIAASAERRLGITVELPVIAPTHATQRGDAFVREQRWNDSRLNMLSDRVRQLERRVGGGPADLLGNTLQARVDKLEDGMDRMARTVGDGGYADIAGATLRARLDRLERRIGELAPSIYR